jgi:hypothetical protein
MLSPVEKLNKEYKDHEEADKEEFARVKAIIHEMILKALPKEIVTEAIQKRYKDPIQVMLFLMIKYQPGSRKEREVILQQIGCPEAGWNEESALTNLRLWKRRIERAKELEVIIPDPTVLMSALDLITSKALQKDPDRKFRILSARQELKVDIQTTYEGVEKLMTILEVELDDMVSQTWTVVPPKIKSIKGTPKGKNGKGKDGKGDGKGKAGKGKDGKGKTRATTLPKPKTDASMDSIAGSITVC